MNLATLPPRREPALAGAAHKSPVRAGSEQNSQPRLTTSQTVPSNAGAADGVPLMNVVCAWCCADLGVKPCLPEMHGKTTHGMCPACYAKELLPDLCAEIGRSSYDGLILLLLSEAMGELDATAARGVRELCRRRQQELHFWANQPVDDLG